LQPLADLLAVANDCPRRRTAAAAIALVDELTRRPEHAVAVLAATDVPTTAAALGTSIAQARAVGDALRSANLPLLEQAMALGGPQETSARALRDRLAEAVDADELTIGLVARLREAEAAATDLLGRAAATAAPVAPAIDHALALAERRRIARADAERRLDEMRTRLRADAQLGLEWQIVEFEADDDA
jgi:hypothetical protein